MQPLKQELINTVQRLPDDINDIDEVMYQLYVMEKLRKSREAIERGDVISHEDLKREMEQW